MWSQFVKPICDILVDICWIYFLNYRWFLKCWIVIAEGLKCIVLLFYPRKSVKTYFHLWKEGTYTGAVLIKEVRIEKINLDTLIIYRRYVKKERHTLNLVRSEISSEGRIITPIVCSCHCVCPKWYRDSIGRLPQKNSWT